MKQLSGLKFCKVLEKYGWKLKRINGSHHIYMKDNNPLRISVPVHGNKPLKKGLLNHFLKITNINEEKL